MQKILLVNFTFPISDTPIAIMGLSIPNISSYLKTNLKTVKIQVFDFYERLHYDSFKKTEEIFYEQIEQFRPDFICISSYLDRLSLLNKITKQIKFFLPNSKIVLGGPLATQLPEKTLELFSSIDMCIKGEGERAILNIIIGEKKTNNTFFRKNKKILVGKHEHYLTEMMNFPDREVFNMDFYTQIQGDLFARKRYLTILSSKGCFGKCTFCIEQIKNEKYCQKKTEKLAEELDYLVKKYKVFNYMFLDNNFDLNIKRIKKLHKLIRANPFLYRKIKFTIQTRAFISSNQMLSLLKDSGCNKISLGIETGSEKLLKKMKKKLTLKQYLHTCRLIKRSGIKLELMLIYNFLDETDSDLDATIKLIKIVKPDSIVLCRLMPIPGTPIYIELVKKNLIQDLNKVKNIENLLQMAKENEMQEFCIKNEKYYEKLSEFQKLIKSIQFKYILSNLNWYQKIGFLLKKKNIIKIKNYLIKDKKYIFYLIFKNKWK